MSLAQNDSKPVSYAQLSSEFKRLYPTVMRALELIPKMYNALTLVDNYSHKEAIIKILEDHKELPGFSKRNIYRALPKDNPAIPKRIVPKRHKSIQTVAEKTNPLSGTEKAEATESKEDVSKPCPNCQPFRIKVGELEEALKKSAGPTKAENYSPQIQRFTVSKERHRELIDSIEKSIEFIRLEFDKNGIFVSAVPDTFYKKIYCGNKSQVA